MKQRTIHLLATFTLGILAVGCHLFKPKEPPTPTPRMSVADSLAIVRKQMFSKTADEAAVLIRYVLENRLPGQRYQVEGRSLYSSVVLPRFYTKREFYPFWIEHPDSLHTVHQMADCIASTTFHGLQADDYHKKNIEMLLESLISDSSAIFNPVLLAHLDLLLSDAWFMMASHLDQGKVDPEALTSQWGIQRNRPEVRLDLILNDLDRKHVALFMQQFYPPHPGYRAMVAEAESLSHITEPKAVKAHARELPIKPGDQSDWLPLIRERLLYWKLYTPDSMVASPIYDEHTAEAVKKLQQKFGFHADGIIGRHTISALNMGTNQRLKHLYVNMERLRWMPDSLEHRYVLVNIADFTLKVMQDDDTLLQMKTIVGKDYRATPVFNSKITYLVFSPAWTVPPGIQKADIIPATARNINYLKEKNMKVYNAQGKEVDPSTINWRRDGMRYTIRQAPGPQNALGKVKFMFPNKYNVYLHDTPSRELFARDERTFSSGCIRLEKPFELAKLLLNDMPEWNDDRIRQAMNSGIERTVVLRSPTGIYIYYLTCWADNNGIVNYRTDIYNRDEEVLAALKQQKDNRMVLIND